MINFRPDVNLKDLLPDWYKEVLDYKQITEAENGLYEIAADDLDEVHGNFFVANMTESAVKEWENTLSIITIPGETFQFRRDRIFNRLSMRPPFTIAFLKQKLNELIGSGNYSITIDAANFTFYVEASAKNQSYATEATITINDIKPAHMVFINRPYVRDEIEITEEIRASKLTYNYVLGSFGLGTNPFASYGPWEVKKMVDVPSIQQKLLDDAAEWLKSDVAKARINDTEVITSLTKTRTDGMLTVEYTVLSSMADAVTKIELLDASDNVLTSIEVYVPIAQNTNFKHVLPFTGALAEESGSGIIRQYGRR